MNQVASKTQKKFGHFFHRWEVEDGIWGQQSGMKSLKNWVQCFFCNSMLRQKISKCWCHLWVPSRYFSGLSHTILHIKTLLTFSRQDFGSPFSIYYLYYYMVADMQEKFWLWLKEFPGCGRGFNSQGAWNYSHFLQHSSCFPKLSKGDLENISSVFA